MHGRLYNGLTGGRMMKNVCKKLVGFIILILCFSFATLTFTACSESETRNETAAEPSKALLNSFESYSEVYDFYYSGAFTFSFSSDNTYVTEGEAAVCYAADPVNAGTITANTFGVPLYNLAGDKNYRDFSKLQRITYDVYNASATEITLATSIMQKKVGIMNSNAQIVTVGAGEKATVTYSVNGYEIFYSLGIDGPTHVNINITGTDPCVYFDNMVLHYGTQTFTAPEIDSTDMDFLTFEKAYEGFVTYMTGTKTKAVTKTDPEFASEGYRYLALERQDAEDDAAVTSNGKFGISAKYLGEFNFSTVAEGSYIAFDYRCGWEGAALWVVPRLVSSTSGGYINGQGVNLTADDEWHTLCMPFDRAPSFFDNIEIDLLGTTYGDVFLDNFRIVSELPAGAQEVTSWALT